MGDLGEIAQAIVNKNKSVFTNDDCLYRSIKVELERIYIEGKKDSYEEAERDFVAFCKSKKVEVN